MIRLAAAGGLCLIGGAAWAAGPDYVPGEIVVKYREHAAGVVIGPGPAGVRAQGLRRLQLPAGESVAQALARYRADPAVEYAEPNYIVRKAVAPDDARFGEQWAPVLIQLPAAWDYTTGDADIVVAILDTGIDYGHPDLRGNLWRNAREALGRPGFDDDGNGYTDDVYGILIDGSRVSGDPKDDDTKDAHGTHVAGIVGAVGDNAIGVAGVAWRVSLMAVKVLHGPQGEGTVLDVAEGIRYAVDNGARVLNLSFTVAEYSRTLADAIAYADGRGALVVSAAGNDGDDLDGRDASPPTLRLPNNLSVAALTARQTLAGYSNYGAHTVDVAAPGGEASDPVGGILSTLWPGAGLGKYGYLAGTSMAAPHVSGLAALVWAAYPSLDAHAVKGRILNGSVSLAGLHGRVISGGRIDAFAALTQGDLPAVFNVTPYSLPAGGEVTIEGVNFGAVAGRVWLDGEPLTVRQWDASGRRILATTPACGSSGRLQVNGAGSGFSVTLAQQPTVTLIGSASTGTAPLTAMFSALAADPNGRIVAYAWDEGSGVYGPAGTADSRLITFSAPGRYSVRVQVTDDCGNRASAVALVEVSPGSGSDSRCFIATAAWGSALHPRVQALRSFRDRVLLPNAPGRALVALYYRWSPPLADVIRHRPALRRITAALLTPVVEAAEWWLALSDKAAGERPPAWRRPGDHATDETGPRPLRRRS